MKKFKLVATTVTLVAGSVAAIAFAASVALATPVGANECDNLDTAAVLNNMRMNDNTRRMVELRAKLPYVNRFQLAAIAIETRSISVDNIGLAASNREILDRVEKIDGHCGLTTSEIEEARRAADELEQTSGKLIKTLDKRSY